MALNVKGLEGNEIADDYVRKAAEGGRFSQTWGVFKSNFGKVVLINILVLLFFLPGVAIMFVRSMYVGGMGGMLPINQSFFYPHYSDTAGLAESLYLSADLLFYSLLIVAGFIASVGIAGGAYSVKKLLNTQGKFSFKGFFHGVRVCYLNTVFPVTVFMAFLFASTIIGDWKNLVIAQGGAAAGPITAYVFIIIATVIIGVYCAWLLAVGVSYRVKPLQLFKNAFVLMIGSPIQTVFLGGFALFPVWLYLIGQVSSIVRIISYILFVFLGFTVILLIWMSFTQWVFDLYITPNLKKAEEEARAKKSPKELAEEKEEADKAAARELLAAGKSELIGKPILPINEEGAFTPLGKTFTRGDFKRISADRAKIGGDIAAYEKEHQNDAVYAEYNKLFAEREKALQSESKGKKNKKKVSSENLLGRK